MRSSARGGFIVAVALAIAGLAFVSPVRGATGGVVSIAETPGAAPDWILPVTPAARATVFDQQQFQYYMWRPLWWAPLGAMPAIDYSQSIASAPVFSNDNKTVTINLNNWDWSDGQPVTATDVEFDIDLVKAAVAESPANYGRYTPGLFPDFITSMSAPDSTTLVLDLNKTYSPNFLLLDELTQLIPLPSHAWSKTSATGPIVDFTDPANVKAIYNFLTGQSRTPGTYATNPLWQVVDGPFKLTSFDAATGGNTMVPNPDYSGPVKAHIAELDNVAFPSTSAEFSQLLAGNLTVGYVDYSDLPQLTTLESAGYNIISYPDFGFSYIAYNFKDATGHFSNIIAQPYIRQALAHLQDQQAIIQSANGFDGDAQQSYGPVPAKPPNPWVHITETNPYPYSISAASDLLSSNGWHVVPGGTTRCARPGTAAGQCGAGIPKGTPLTWNLIYANSPAVIGAQVQQLATAAKQDGITISLKSATFNYIHQNLSDAGNPASDNKWAMEDFGHLTDSLYPTSGGVFNSTGTFNVGGYTDPAADADIAASSTSLNTSALATEIKYLTGTQPGLFQPNPRLTIAFKNTLTGPGTSFSDATQYQYSPEYWSFTS